MPRASAREQLVDAALAVFYREGFHATGIERVLAEAFYQSVEFTYRLMKALTGTR